MQKSTILFLLISYLFVSCGVNPVKDLTSAAPDKKIILNPYFSNPETDYVYRAKITVYGKELSGILITKKINDSIHRLVISTDFGNKLMDVELGDNSFKVNSIVEELDRKILIATLQEDFRLLLQDSYPVLSQFKDGDNTIYESVEKNTFYYLFESHNNRLYKLVKGSKRKQKITVNYSAENNIFAEKITIQHDNIKLRIELNSITNP